MNPKLCRAARVVLDWSQDELGKRADLSPRVVGKYEQGLPDVAKTSIARMEQAFKDAGVAFIQANGVQGVIVATGASAMV